LPITPEFNGKWDDDTIYSGGTDSLSLFGFLRKKTQDFVEHRVINSLILGMTLFLCLVIFSELSISEYIDKYEGLGNFYKFLNFFLLTFFMIEIILKSFALGYIFISEFINVFDSVIVIVSFAFLLIGSLFLFISGNDTFHIVDRRITGSAWAQVTQVFHLSPH